MSLVKQLILAICVFMLLAFGGSFLINLDSSRDQLQEQLNAHAHDAATALGLALSAHVEDPAMMELMVSSLFDTSYFSEIRIVAIADGSTLASRQRIEPANTVPDWFEKLAGIQARQGTAVLMDGWQQFARIEVTSHPHFALSSLWNSAMRVLGWLLLCGLVVGALGSLLLHRQLRPLQAITAQAEAISRREYHPLNEIPTTPELKKVGLAMNLMVAKLKRIFEEDAAQTEDLRRQAYHDGLTDLPNRLAFEHALAAAASPEEGTGGGILAIRLPHLAIINARTGAALTDTLLQALAAPLKTTQSEHPNWLSCRTRGSEFMVLAPGANEDELQKLADQIALLATHLEGLAPGPADAPVQIGITAYRPGDSSAAVLSRLDEALMQSSFSNGRIEAGFSRSVQPRTPARTSHDWSELLRHACETGAFELHFQPVLRVGTKDPLHYKVLARLREGDEQLLDAAQFIPWIERLQLNQTFDLCMLRQTLAHAANHSADLALSLTAATFASPEARQELLAELTSHAMLAPRLTLEVDMRYVQDPQPVEQFAADLRRAGAGLALQHAGRDMDATADLASGLAYLKLDSSFIRALDREPEKQRYLTALIRTARRFDLPVIAEQVQSQGEINALQALGVEWMQGHALAQPSPWGKS